MELIRSLTSKNKGVTMLLAIIFIIGLIAVIISMANKMKPEEVFQKLSTDKQPSSTSKPLASQGPSWNAITPGISEKENIVSELGKPLKESGSNLEKVLTYGSSSPTRSHKVYLEGEKAVMVKEIVTRSDGKKVTDITSEYGEADTILYGPDAINAYYLYIYPSDGIAYLGNQYTGTLLEIWYFIPSSLSEFKSKWTRGYSTKFIPRF